LQLRYLYPFHDHNSLTSGCLIKLHFRSLLKAVHEVLNDVWVGGEYSDFSLLTLGTCRQKIVAPQGSKQAIADEKLLVSAQ
jgi:hypothetical protein